MNADEIISEAYYDPSKGLRNAQKLYEELKAQRITMKQIKDFLKRQEVAQIHYKPQKPVFFPIVSKYKNHIWQIDLMSLADIERTNDHYKYLLCCIDIFSRFAYVVPLKTKDATTIKSALDRIFKKEVPEILCSDNGSEFKNEQVKRLCTRYNISQTFFQVGDKHKMAMVERFNRTIRDLINKYLTAYQTTRYINVLDKLVHNYNNTYHSGIKGKPSKPDAEKIKSIMIEKQVEALKSEKEYKVGQSVRYVINRTTFEKGSNPRWSKLIYVITSKLGHSYLINKRGSEDKEYKYYELQPVGRTQGIDVEEAQPTRQHIRRENRQARAIKREGITTTSEATTSRARRPTGYYEDTERYDR